MALMLAKLRWYSIRVSGKWLDDGGIGGEMVSGCFPKAVGN
jgi:hypothetical protein